MTTRSPRLAIDRRQLLALAAGAGIALPGIARAQAYPARPVRVIVPYPAGGGADTVSRILFQKLGEDFGQTFIIENRGGAAGTAGAAAVASAPADGYTVLYDATAHSVNPSLFARLPYDTLAAFSPVFLAAVVPNLLLVNPRSPVRTVPDVVAAARASSGGLDWASSGNGSAQHLAMELFRAMANIPINHVPYRGGGPALNDLIANQIGYFFSNASSSIGHVRGGTLRAVAHTAQGRLAQLPDLPSVAETLPGYEALEWNGVFVPAGTPRDVIARLNAGLNAVVATPAISERLTSLTVQTRANTPEQFGAFVRAEMEKWGGIVRRANIRPD